MSQSPPRVVFDAVIFVQALISGRGPSAACIDHALRGDVTLFTSQAILAEINDVPRRPELTRRYSQLTPQRIDGFIQEIQTAAVHVSLPKKAFSLPRDPKDEPYTDLAVEVNAPFLVTWNARHLTYLMNQDTPEGLDFCVRFPFLKILSPVSFLQEISKLQRP